MTEERKQFNERYDKLPPAVKEAIDAVETAELIQAISEEHKLHIDQMGEFSHLIGSLMLGIVKPQEFVPNLREKLGVKDEEARAMALEVNEQIFAPIRESLKQVHAMKEGEQASGEPKISPSDGAPKEEKIKTKPVTSDNLNTKPSNFDPIPEQVRYGVDDRLGRYLTSNKSSATTPTSHNYGHDPYHEPVDSL